jgi:hypothetical protein
MSRIELQRHWSALTRGRGTFVSEKTSDRLRASELLGRSLGVFLDRVETTNLDIDLGSMTVAQLREKLEAPA